MDTQHHTHVFGPGILPFPTKRTRPPAWSVELFTPDAWRRCNAAANIAQQFRTAEPVEADALVSGLIASQGAGAVATILEGNTAAIASLRAAIAFLFEADRRVAEAADRVLAAGFEAPQETRAPNTDKHASAVATAPPASPGHLGPEVRS